MWIIGGPNDMLPPPFKIIGGRGVAPLPLPFSYAYGRREYIQQKEYEGISRRLAIQV